MIYDTVADVFSLHLNGSPTVAGTLANPDSAGGGANWIALFSINGGMQTEIDYYRVATGAYPNLIREPATLVLLLGGLGALLCKRRADAE
jgi:hypothetical protein